MADIIFPTQITDWTPTWTARILFDDWISAKDCAISELPISTATQNALNAKQNTSEKWQANWYASLDWSWKVPTSQLPWWGGGWDMLSSTYDPDWWARQVAFKENNELISFQENLTPPNTPWSIYWANWFINIVQEWWVIQQVWFEQFKSWQNNTWTTIEDWSVVYFSSAIWNSWNIRISKFIANRTIDYNMIIWIVTQDILNWEVWAVTYNWKVRGINTTDFAEWDILYASPTVAGWLTNVKPSFPNQIIPIWVVTSSSVNWTIEVRVTWGLQEADEVYYDNATSWLTANNVKSAIDELSNEKQNILSEWAFVDWDKTKLNNIEAWAEVNNISDTNAIDLTDGWDTTLHTHDWRYYTETETNTLLSNKVPTSRTLTINWTTYDLSANRSWNITAGASFNWINWEKFVFAWEVPDWDLIEFSAIGSWNLNEIKISSKTRTTWTTTITLFKNWVSQWTATITSWTALENTRYFWVSSWITWSFVNKDVFKLTKTDTWSPWSTSLEINMW